MTTTLMKAIILLLAINTILYIGGVRVIGGDNPDLLSNFIDTTIADQGNQVVVTDDFKETLPTSIVQSGSQVLDFIDSIRAVRTFIFFMVNIVFTPVGLFMGIGFPQELVLMIGMPFMIALWMGMAYFIRTGG